MKKRFLIVLLFYISSCDQHSPRAAVENSIADSSNIPNIAYSIINARTDDGGQFFDIYIKDTTRIETLNSFLKAKFKNIQAGWIQINYFTDSVVAKTYFSKQFASNISDKQKDNLFRYYIANYKYTPTTGYDTLVFEH
jgi:hypothetical protein